MKPHNFLEEEIHNVSSIITFVEGNKVSHIGELIHYHHGKILSLRCPWKGHNEVYGNVIPRPCRNRKKSVEALMKVTLSHMINVIPYDHIMTIPIHLGQTKNAPSVSQDSC